MTNHVSPSAARASHDPDEAAERDRDRTRRRQQAERDLAELEALLTKQLKGSASPSIAAGTTNDEPPLRGRQPAWPRAAAPRSEPELSARRAQREPEHSFSPALDRLEDLPPSAAIPRADKRAPIARAMGFAATFFSLFALVAVSALLVMLAIGSEPAAQVEGEAARTGEPAVAGNAPDSSPAAEPVGPAVETGSIEAKRDTSRIPSEEYAPRAFGTVRAVDTQPASAQAPQAAEPLTATPPAENIRTASAFAAPSTFAPPAEEQASAARAFAPANAGAESARESAPLQSAAAEAGSAAGQAAETRSAPVTTHVNLRATPDNDAAVVVVVPKGRNVEVVDCTQWCEVVYDGRQGFIHKRFVTGAGG